MEIHVKDVHTHHNRNNEQMFRRLIGFLNIYMQTNIQIYDKVNNGKEVNNHPCIYQPFYKRLITWKGFIMGSFLSQTTKYKCFMTIYLPF